MLISYCGIEVTNRLPVEETTARRTCLNQNGKAQTSARAPASGAESYVMSQPCLAIAGLVPCLILVSLNVHGRRTRSFPTVQTPLKNGRVHSEG
ncbi:hypothetical protein BJX66DRAFT_306985 [Aspergillus keveii]|uniref:Uncharacterized protein n=1 Tax=Aspergillus keveii TaxID=714993 RepID=A0ABR4G1F5_9EURO